MNIENYRFTSSKGIYALLVFAVILITIDGIFAKTLECEKVESEMRWDKPRKTCFMNSVTKIDTPDCTIKSPIDHSILQLFFVFNQGIKFIPINIWKAFPDLVILHAHDCQITTIKKENLANLNKMEYLGFRKNQITQIPDNTFEDLVSLKMLYLGRYVVRKMFMVFFNLLV